MSVAELKKYVIRQLETADINLDITLQKKEEDELKKFAFYTNEKSESAQNQHDFIITALDGLKTLSHQG